ncbi:hypothetical protein A6P54_13815 [Bacillus sp. MKU004]|uniref:archaellin/type IV pilin N-terminal domain-containing protein n=1 Tax=[Bacillus] enclensis TaxID=1402860 RepID=UPI0007E3AC8A|nr:archaellin/type IV pilin N-terminal domain-containing protein [[Bacillus] enclensis]MBH9965668.1 hypothetical protein [[Bacillus] enclensis]OAT80463.1 hypothetical protein A6P54_13815 [Bacillus sp. MKU004]
MRTGSIILTAIMAGVYSGILDVFEESRGLTPIISALLLIIMTFGTAILLRKVLPQEGVKK